MYTEKRLELLMVGAAAPDDLSSAAVHSQSYLVLSPMMVDNFLASVTTVTVGPATIALKRRPTFGSATGESTLASIVIPGATAAGQTLFKKFKGVKLEVGDELVFEITAAATSGAALYGVEVDECPEDYRNNDELSESA